jgi:hypothetical protein
LSEHQWHGGRRVEDGRQRAVAGARMTESAD